MKKCIIHILVIVILLFIGNALAESNDKFGIWNLRAYVDEFNIPTNEYYIVSNPISGVFSNSVATNEELTAYILYQMRNGNGVLSIRLAEYGEYVVKNIFPDTEFYSITMMDTKGKRNYLSGYMLGNSQDVYFDTTPRQISEGYSAYTNDNTDVINELTLNEGTVRFAITAAQNPLNSYTFTISDTTGFMAAKDALNQKNNTSLYAELGIGIGTRIKHSSYGIGTIIGINSSWAPYIMVEIKFDDNIIKEFDYVTSSQNGYLTVVSEN